MGDAADTVEVQCDLQLHFVLIHGAFHGAWAWYRLEDALLKAGCKVSSMDMTGAGMHPADPDTVTSWEDYHQPLLDFFANSLPEHHGAAAHEKVVLVGHSLGGMANLMLMERFPHKIDLAVFVAASITPTGVALVQDLPVLTLMANGPASDTQKEVAFHYRNGPKNAATSFYYPTSKLHNLFYNGLDSEITVLASKLVVRPCPYRIMETPITYTTEKHGQVPAVYIRCSQDHTLAPAAQDYIATHYGPFREVVHLDGGHFDFLQRPKEFTLLLTKLAHQHIT